ncbi:hypothetical protein [Desulfurivibrio dismutans]|uniref:hypothetical protein n=1 Tax=Desulfurivibrio dismutans TaxID=1398908 RepID=UPI0023DB2D08|nr:hypothetical protein [Desulfurivibrio alkaliphilus]MDF1614707.1 hypothetical protein [Desulfurivibrio alkaliphilus]
MVQDNNRPSGVTGGLPLVQYARKEDGGCCRISSADTAIVDVVNQQAWQALAVEISAARRRVEAGKASPIYYYMVVNQMDPALLGKYMGIAVWRVRWHLRPMGFRRLQSAMLRRYAGLFRVTEHDLRRGVLWAAVYDNQQQREAEAAYEQQGGKGAGESGA